MNYAVEITTNQFQQNVSIKLAHDYLSILLTGNVMKFSVDLTNIFNSADSSSYFPLFNNENAYLRRRELIFVTLLNGQ